VVRHRVLVPAFVGSNPASPATFLVPVMAHSKNFKIFNGNGSPNLIKAICTHLDGRPTQAEITHFSDGEIHVQIGENIRGSDVFIVNATRPPVNDNLIELLIMIDAAKRASANRVTAVLPYFGYARQDRKDRPRVAITAKLVSNLLVAAGADRILTVDLHAGQIQGFFDIPLDHLSAEVVFADHLSTLEVPDLTIVSPDVGSVRRIRDFAARIDRPMAIVDKRRAKANESEVMNVIGDVKDQNVLIFDDMIDTGGTLVRAAEAIRDRGAKDVWACATHAVLSGPAIDRIMDSCLSEVWVTDTIPLSDAAEATGKFKVLSIAPLIAEAIRRIHQEESVSSLFRK
jgi:ribose-phosphate pyrophosphokinase